MRWLSNYFEDAMGNRFKNFVKTGHVSVMFIVVSVV